MNNAVLLGRFTKDMELRYSQGDNPTAVLRNSIAVNRRFNPQEADFINIVAFGKTAEFIDRYFGKGDKICVQGHIQTGSYTNRDGGKVYTTEVIIDQAEFAESQRVATAKTEEEQRASAPEASDDDFMNIPEGISEELPFN